MWSPYTNPRGIQIPGYARAQPAATPALSDINAASGPEAATGTLFTRMAESLIAGSAQDQAAYAVDQATIKGSAAGDAAAADMAAPDMKDDATMTGRAFNLAQTRAWQARMQIGLDQTGEKILSDHPDDPEAVTAKWAGTVGGLKSHLPPSLAAEVGVALDRSGARLVSVADGNRRKKAEGEANAELINGIALSSTKSANAWRDGDSAIAQGHDQDARNYLFARTDLTPQAKAVQWQVYQQERNRDAVLGEYQRAKDAGGLGGATRFVSSFTDGDHPALNPDFVARLGNEMAQDVRGLEAEHRVQIQDLKADASDAIYRMSRGYGAPNLDKLISRARALGDGGTMAQLAEMGQTSAELDNMAKMPLPDQAASVAHLEARAKAGTDRASVARAEMARSVYDNSIKELSKDPLAHAAEVGQKPIAPLDWSKPDSMANRVQEARVVWDYNQLPGPAPVLTKAEVSDLSARLAGSTADQKTDLIGKLYQGFGPSALPQVLDAVKATAPDFAQAAAIAGMGGHGVAKDILRGSDIRASYEKKGSPGGRQYMPPNDAMLSSAFDTHLPHSAIANLTPDDGAGLKSAILSSYAAKSFDKGLVHQQVVDPDLFKSAVKDVTGGVVRWNGRDLVAPERGMSQDRFEKMMAGTNQASFLLAHDGQGRPVASEMIRDNGIFEMIAPGKYLVRLGKDAKSYLADQLGRPYVADLGLEAKFRRGD